MTKTVAMTAFGLSSIPVFPPALKPGTCPWGVGGSSPSHHAHPRRSTIVSRRNANKTKEKRRGDNRRPNRVGELIRREISPIIDDAFSMAFETEKGSPVLVSVEDVMCSPDLRNARVSISIMGTVDQKALVLKWLKDTKKSLRFELAQCLHMKYVPELIFGESEVSSATKTVNILEMLAYEREEKAKLQSGVAVAPEPIPGGTDLEVNADAAGAILDDDDIEADTIAPSYTDRDMDADDNPEIVDVGEDDDDLEGMSDESIRKLLFSNIDLQDGGV